LLCFFPNFGELFFAEARVVFAELDFVPFGFALALASVSPAGSGAAAVATGGLGAVFSWMVCRTWSKPLSTASLA